MKTWHSKYVSITCQRACEFQTDFLYQTRNNLSNFDRKSKGSKNFDGFLKISKKNKRITFFVVSYKEKSK